MISWYQKLVIGAFGGLCLGLLKLISSNFYLGMADRSAVLGAYLTYLVYVVLGMAVGYFFSEDQPDPQKTRKSAFLVGLLAPSILLAVIAKPINATDGNSGGKSSGIPSLSENILDQFIAHAFAQATSSTITSDKPTVRSMKRDEVAFGFDAGVKSALGIRQLPREKAVFVVGKSNDEKIAAKTAEQIDTLLKNSDSAKDYRATVLKPEGGVNYFVTVGDVVSGRQAEAIEIRVKEAALKTLIETSSGDAKATAKILGKGDVYKGSALFEK